MNRQLLILLLLLSIGFTTHTAAADDANNEFIRKFSEVPQKQQLRFQTNRKLTIVNKYYDIKLDDNSKAKATIYDDCDITKIFGSDTNMISVVTASRVIPKKLDSVFIRNKDIYFTLERSDKTFVIDQFVSRKDGEYRFLINFQHTGNPTGMFNGMQSIELMCHTLKDQSRLAGRFAIIGLSQSVWKGKPALCVRSKTVSTKPDPKSGITKDCTAFEENFFDESNALAYLGTIAKNDAGMNFRFRASGPMNSSITPFRVKHTRCRNASLAQSNSTARKVFSNTTRPLLPMSSMSPTSKSSSWRKSMD